LMRCFFFHVNNCRNFVRFCGSILIKQRGMLRCLTGIRWN
jgi:hypothetical protein